MIYFRDWEIETDGMCIARQYDHLTRTLTVADVPEGWVWDLLVQVGPAADIIPLEEVEGGVGVTLTEDMLAASGVYALQLRGRRGDMTRHTNVICALVPESLTGSGQWPEVPTAFIQAERDIRELNAHPPIPGTDGFWQLWSTEDSAYHPSQLPLPEAGGAGYAIGSGLILDEDTNTLSVDTATTVEEDNTRPITSAAVYQTVGNINSLLESI